MTLVTMTEKEHQIISTIVKNRLQIHGLEPYSTGFVMAAAEPLLRLTLPSQNRKKHLLASTITHIVTKIRGEDSFIYQICKNGQGFKYFPSTETPDDILFHLNSNSEISFIKKDFTEGCHTNLSTQHIWVFGHQAVSFCESIAIANA